MTESECLSKMIPPGQHRPGKYGSSRGYGGVIQIHVTRACNMSCFGCTQASNIGGKTTFMTPMQFHDAVMSLRGYPGIYGVFGGNPAVSPHFVEYCEILRKNVPFQQRGLWCNDPMTMEKGKAMAETFDPAVSNLNVHLDKNAYDNFRRWWPAARPFGLDKDSRHSPPFVAMKDVIADEDERWELISRCDINQHWSAMIGVFRGELRAWFCEVAGAQSILHQDEPNYPDTGLDPTAPYMSLGEPAPSMLWWQMPMENFRDQVRKHCHDCGIPLKGYGNLAQDNDTSGVEQVSATHESVYKPKRKGRRIELVTLREQLHEGRLERMTDYIGNSKR